MMWWKRSSPSLESMLKRVLGRKRWELLRQQPCEPRLLCSHAAALFGVVEEDLVSACARQGKLRSVTKVEPINLAALPEGVLLSHLHASGAVPVVNHGFIVSVACVDPHLLAKLPLPFMRSQVSLASWPAVSQALEESEDRLRALQRSIPRALPAAEFTPGLRIIRAMVEEAAKYQAHKLQVQESEGSVTYRFTTGDGRLAEGEVESRGTAPLRAELSRLATIGASSIDSERAIRVTVDGSGSYTILTLPIGEPAQECVTEHTLDGLDTSNVTVVPGSEEAGIDPAPTAPGKLALVVEDNECFAKVLGRFFGRHGLETRHVSACEQALDMLQCRSIKPDLIVSDVHMSGMNGFQFLKEVRRIAPELPVVMLTSDNDVETQLSLLRDGADAFARKTDDPRILCAQAMRLLLKRRAA